MTTMLKNQTSGLNTKNKKKDAFISINRDNSLRLNVILLLVASTVVFLSLTVLPLLFYVFA